MASTVTEVPEPRKAPARSRLRIENVRGRSRATVCESVQPLRIITPSTYTGCCCAFVTNYGGGFVQGDSVALDAECGSDAKLFLTTQANTRIYTSENGMPTRQDISGRLRGNSLGVVFTDPVVPHSGSRFTQAQEWTLETKSSLVLVDWLSSGRSEIGETFAFEHVQTSVRVQRDGHAIISDRFGFAPSKQCPLSAGRFARFNSQVNTYLVGPRTNSIVSALNETLSNPETGPTRRHLPADAGADEKREQPRALYSISAMAPDIHIVRALAVQRSDLDAFVNSLSALLNTETLLACDPLARRQ